MSASPPGETQDMLHTAQSPDSANDQMNELLAAGIPLDFDVKEQDRWLPIANVARIMKQALPDNAKIAKEAKECMQECVSEFISFITSEASEKCQQEKRKTVNGEDILFAMTSLGFENYSEALKIYLSKYREMQNTTAKIDAAPSQSTNTVFDRVEDENNGVVTDPGAETFPLVDDANGILNNQLDGTDDTAPYNMFGGPNSHNNSRQY